MRTVLILVGIWILINVLFVVVMIPSRKPRKPGPGETGTLAPARIDQKGHPVEEQDKVLFRHVIISIALGAFFSLTPPLIEAIDSIKRFFGKHRQ
ncbi:MULTISPECIES: hypothetical protein [Bradyrhizobium]|uniref:Phosphonate metabolism protein PhnM n=1 Tax=Bradyrhizobium neotropicale TaxID=1497615 RepID=A0A176ZI27_9BRAD|nr:MULTISPECIES: hypothetical protein [Bradyrhizobium]OAF19532.1 hypothetical protein AXW67_01800 [Bradyrhizobium neotropicale]